LEKATGCPDAEADRLLAQWDTLSAGYIKDPQREAEGGGRENGQLALLL
jgi:hypothetical protein